MNEYEGLVHDMAQQIMDQNSLLDGLELPITDIRDLKLRNFPDLLHDVENEIENLEAEAGIGRPVEEPGGPR